MISFLSKILFWINFHKKYPFFSILKCSIVLGISLWLIGVQDSSHTQKINWKVKYKPKRKGDKKKINNFLFFIDKIIKYILFNVRQMMIKKYVKLG